MNAETSREVGAPDRQTEENPQGADPDTENTNPERQGPNSDPEPADAQNPETERASSEPPPESIPGDEGQVPNPRQ
jgi:hypothetical protein